MRRMCNYPPLFLVLNLMLGILLSKQYKINLRELTYVLLCCGVVVFLGIIVKRFRPIPMIFEGILFFIITVFVGLFSYAVTDIRNSTHYYGTQLTRGEVALFTVEIQERLRSNSQSERFTAK